MSERESAKVLVTDAMVERASHAICTAIRERFGGDAKHANTLVLARVGLEAGLNPPRHKHTARCYDAFAKPGFQGPDCGFEDENE